VTNLPKSVLNYIIYDEHDHLEIEHDGTATWADIQAVKNIAWGADAIAIEIYPPRSQVLNGNSKEFHYRHLWRYPNWMSWPNIRTP